AVVSTLIGLARARPVLVAVDDIQWLDPPSAGALDFVARRLDVNPVGLCLSQRVPSRVPLRLERALEARLRRLRIGPLSLGALHQLLRARLGQSFSRPALIRIERISGG